MGIMKKDDINTRYFKFRLETETSYYTIPQSVADGTDVITFSSNWTKQNIPGSTEPMVAFNYNDAPTLNINLKFHEDMWREAGLATTGYLEAINKFASIVYPGANGAIIKPPYVKFSYDLSTYRGYFTNIRINQSGPIRNGYRIYCEINGSFVVIRKYAPTQLGVKSGFRSYFGN